MEKYIRYQSAEILQILQANYRQHQQFDDAIVKNQPLTFSTTIWEWMDIYDIVDTHYIWKYLNHTFRLDISKEIWLTILEPDQTKTLDELCNFISSYTNKEIIKPVRLFGSACETAAIFKLLMKRMQDRGIDVSQIKPSSKLEPLIKKYNLSVIEEINLISPSALPVINFKDNLFYRLGIPAFILFFFITAFLVFIGSAIAWVTGACIIISYGSVWLGQKMKPKHSNFDKIDTIGDLVNKIHMTLSHN
jgi:hypothetical protein